MSDSSSDTSFRVIVKFSQSSGHPHLTMEVGDVVVVTDSSDADWWKGHVEDRPGVAGWFPASFVENQDDTVDGIILRACMRAARARRELESAMKVLTLCTKLASARKILNQG